MKKTLINFLKNGLYEGSRFTGEDMIKKLPVLEHLIKPQPAVQIGVYSNDNIFWKYENEAKRLCLINWLENVWRFDAKDPWFSAIMTRYETGDAFGVLKPVFRAQKENISDETLEEVYNHFTSQGVKLPSYWRFREGLTYKVVYCGQNGFRFMDAVNWYWCEMLLSEPINFIEYKVVDACVYDSPENLVKIYLNDEYNQILGEMKTALQDYRAELPQKLDSMPKLILDDLDDYCEEGFLEKLNFVFQACEPPEGASETDKTWCKRRVDLILQDLPIEDAFFALSTAARRENVFLKNKAASRIGQDDS